MARRPLIVVACGLAAFLSAAAPCAPSDAAFGRYPTSLDALAAEVRPGDIVFRRGRSVSSLVVLSAGESSRYSHVGIVVATGGQTLIAHAAPAEDGAKGGVQISSWTEFSGAATASAVAAYRPDYHAAGAALAANTALTLVGRPFDGNYRVRPVGSFYCTQLVLEALSAPMPSVRAQITPTPVAFLEEPVYLPDSLLQLKDMYQLGSSD